MAKTEWGMMEYNLPEFAKFDKIPRLFRDIVITEKIDGTNGQIFIDDDLNMCVGSRNRWLSEHADNYGFWHWCRQHRRSIVNGLGPGRHFGEWWGKGIQRGYDVPEKRFSLFNTHRWDIDNTPPCIGVVPVLYQGPFDLGVIEQTMEALAMNGSVVAPGYMNPEGIVVFHRAGNHLYKATLKDDHKPKGA